MKSRSPLSAHWRSSKTMTTGSSARDPFEEGAPRREQLLAARRPSGSPTPSRVSSAGSIQRRSALVRDPANSATSRRCASRVVASSSLSASPARSRTISPRAQNVIAAPVRRRAALVPVDGLHEAVDVLEELPGEAALADAALAGDRDEPHAAISRASRGSRSLSSRSSSSRPTNGASSACRPTPPAALGDDAEGAPRGDGRGLALEQVLAGRLERDRAAMPPASSPRPTSTAPAVPRPTAGGWRC